MRSFLLTWNPRSWDWTNLAEDLEESRLGRPVEITWRCHNKSPIPGDQVFLLRQGVEPRGIMGSGEVLSETYREEPEGRRVVDVQLTTLLDPAREGVLLVSKLQAGALADVHWETQSSGIAIPVDAESVLLGRWRRFLKSRGRTLTVSDPAPTPRNSASNDSSQLMFEGDVRSVVLTEYERDWRARRRCIAYYGVRCTVCEMSFEERYGKSMAGFIHVHHLTPISKIGKKYQVDPIKDLRPVCPNCHAVIHRKREAVSIEKARRLIARTKR